MPINGVITTISATEQRAHTNDHPPVLGRKAVKADNGEYPGGLVCVEDANGDLVPLTDLATETVVCIIDEPVDTAETSSAPVLRHGTVRSDLLVMGADMATALTADALKALEAVGIYAL